jgi:hypothetical protein
MCGMIEFLLSLPPPELEAILERER